MRVAFDEYTSRRDLPDYYSRYRALESVYATTIKHIGATCALLAADYDADLRDTTWTKIFSSSSLGGWLDAADLVCSRSSSLPDAAQNYCSEYSNYRRHPSRTTLDKIAEHINPILDQLARSGYRIDRARSLNIIRALRQLVAIRNKCAHGALNSVFFSRIEADLLAALKLILTVVPFSTFVFWGSFGGNAVEFMERTPKQRRRKRDSHFWAESPLLSSGFTDRIPFLIYQEDSRSIYFLNDAVMADSPRAEYLDYASGQVMVREVLYDWPQPVGHLRRTARPRSYGDHLQVLSDTPLTWREVPLTKAGVDACTSEIGVYVFSANVGLGTRPVEVILYVGKTTNLAERLQSYVRIKKGYNSSRPEITHMFAVYSDAVKFSFAIVPRAQTASVERAIYETTMPEFNAIAPPDH